MKSTSKLGAALALGASAAAIVSAPAWAGWVSAATGTGAAKAASLPTGSQPAVSVSNRSVTVDWSASALPGGASVDGYVVKRHATGGQVQTIGAGCSGTLTALTCTESSVPAGDWRYSVSPKHGNWLGAESTQSAVATVASPMLSFSSSTTLSSLPATLGGTIANFVPGQTVTYRLDDATSGTTLTGSISPTPVQSSGGANVSVTIPAGTASGAHTVYAIGSAGDVASAGITVTSSTTIATSVWDIRDASAGAAEANVTASTAAADARTFPTGIWSASFGAKYIDFDMNGPLSSAQAVSGASFIFRFAAAAAGEQACFYFELRRISTGLPVSTHGSSTTPAGCVTGTTQQTVSTNLPALTSSADATDLRVRVYVRESASKLITIDMATLTGSSGGTAFTLYPTLYTDATGTATTTRWGPAASGDGSVFATAANWASAFATSRYLKFTFPAYVPSGATVTSATLRNYYRPTTSGRNACWYFEVYAGTTLIATHGSSSAPVSCNSTTTYTTDAVPMPSVNTPARANTLSVKAYYNISGTGTRTTQHDLVTLSVTYTGA
jgi:hypothetical protein